MKREEAFGSKTVMYLNFSNFIQCLEADNLIEALSLTDTSTSDSFIQVSLVITEYLLKDQCTGQGNSYFFEIMKG